MFTFLKRVLSSFVGTLVALIVFFTIITAILIGVVYSLSKDKEVDGNVLKDNSVLELKLSSPIKEFSNHDPLSDFDVPIELGENAIGIAQIIGTLEKAAADPKIKGLYLHFGNPQASYAVLEEVRNQLIKFKESGKFVIYFSNYVSEKALYLATIADEAYVTPSGLVEFNGISVEREYYKGLLEKLGIEPIIFRVGKYKSAVEPFMREDMSEASRLQTEAFINSIFTNVTTDISENTNTDQSEIVSIANELKIRKPEDAADLNVITRAAYEDEVLDTLRSRLSLEEDEKINFVHLSSYSETFNKESESTDKIALIVAEGEITMGETKTGSSIGMDLAETIREARKDKQIKAVVLRINSPGGSALTSDIIWKEIIELKKEKPIIASMSGLAASGGYYIAMPCDTILAYPTTITGSIGVFGMLANVQGLMEDKLGITYDRVKTSPYADLGNPNRPMTDEEKAIIQAEVNRIYDDFTTKAAEGRNLPVDSIKAIAQGRVWSGQQALEIGLVDILGGYQEAIAIAAEKANIEDYTIDYLPKQEKSFVEELVGGSLESVVNGYTKRQLKEYHKTLEFIERIQSMDKVQARLPYTIEVK